MTQAAKKIRASEPSPAAEPVAVVESPKVTRVYPAQAASSAAAKAVRKATPKPKTQVVRVPAAEVIALIAELKITRSQLGQALGVSPSMVSEFVGKGRGNLMARSRWPEAQKKARAFAKKSLK